MINFLNKMLVLIFYIFLTKSSMASEALIFKADAETSFAHQTTPSSIFEQSSIPEEPLIKKRMLLLEKEENQKKLQEYLEKLEIDSFDCIEKSDILANQEAQKTQKKLLKNINQEISKLQKESSLKVFENKNRESTNDNKDVLKNTINSKESKLTKKIQQKTNFEKELEPLKDEYKILKDESPDSVELWNLSENIKQIEEKIKNYKKRISHLTGYSDQEVIERKYKQNTAKQQIKQKDRERAKIEKAGKKLVDKEMFNNRKERKSKNKKEISNILKDNVE